jgi:hypothetical protein
MGTEMNRRGDQLKGADQKQGHAFKSVTVTFRKPGDRKHYKEDVMDSKRWDELMNAEEKGEIVVLQMDFFQSWAAIKRRSRKSSLAISRASREKK